MLITVPFMDAKVLASNVCYVQCVSPPLGGAKATSRLLQTVTFSEETKDEVNLDVLDDVAWRQIQKLTVSILTAALR